MTFSAAHPFAPLHVVLGAGQVGSLLARRLAARGLRVRVVRRTATAAPGPGIEPRCADVRDPDQAATVMRGAAVVYHCVNPLYTEWATELPALTRGILRGAARSGARLVVLDNLYMYGADTARIDELTPMAPRSRKGELRVQATESLLGAHLRGDVRVAIGRASDYFGPGAATTSIFGDRFFRRVLAGKSADCFGDPDQPHSYSFTPDVAAGLEALGRRDDAGGVWMLPVQPAESTRAVIARFGRALGRELEVSRIPTWALHTLGVVSPMLRETAEMAYQWRQPFAVDDRRIRAAFGVAATPWDQAIATTVAWAHTAYTPQRRAAA